MNASATPAAIVAEAVSWLGTPYKHQASVKGVGCDCLGLVRGVWRALYGAEPELAPGYTRRPRSPTVWTIRLRSMDPMASDSSGSTTRIRWASEGGANHRTTTID